VSAVWLALAAFLVAQQAQSFVSGRVIDVVTRQPIVGASVLLVRSDVLTACTVVNTDDQGRFILANLSAGSYRVRVGRDKYLPSELTPVEIKDHGTTKDGMMPTLTPEAVISGRVTDPDGEPAVRVFVRAYSGEKLAAEARTNDLGEYRLFGLASGAYVISAERYPGPRVETSTQMGGRTFPGAAVITPTPPCPDCPGEGMGRLSLSSILSTGAFIDPRALTGETYPTVFYPATTDRDQATPIKVKAGARIDAIDLTLIVGR
jgi:hypothetical protein